MADNSRRTEVIRNPHTGSFGPRPQPDRSPAKPVSPPPANPKPNESKK